MLKIKEENVDSLVQIAQVNPSRESVVDALSQLYAGYDVELHKRDGRHLEARAGQAALSQVMLKLGLVEACRARLTALGL